LFKIGRVRVRVPSIYHAYTNARLPLGGAARALLVLTLTRSTNVLLLTLTLRTNTGGAARAPLVLTLTLSTNVLPLTLTLRTTTGGAARAPLVLTLTRSSSVPTLTLRTTTGGAARALLVPAGEAAQGTNQAGRVRVRVRARLRLRLRAILSISPCRRQRLPSYHPCVSDVAGDPAAHGDAHHLRRMEPSTRGALPP